MSGRVIGWVDILDTHKIAGWAYVEGDVKPVEVVIRVGATEVARVQADQLRPGLRDQGDHPTGLCGFLFRFATPIELRDATPVTARVVGSERDLPLSRTIAKPAPKVVAPPEVVVLPDFPKPETRSGLQIVRDTFFALLLREVRNRYGAFRFGYVWAVAQPLIFVVIMNQSRHLLGGTDAKIFGVSGFYFFVIGILPYFMFQHAYNQSMGTMASMRGLFSYRAVRPMDGIVVRCVIEFALLGVVMALLMLGMTWLGSSTELENPLAFFAAILLLFVVALGAGLIADVYVTMNEESRRVFSLIERPLFFLSGVFFVAEVVPEPLRAWLMWNPLLHAIDLGRGAVLTEYESPCSWLYLSLWAFGLLTFGIGAYRRNLHRLG